MRLDQFSEVMEMFKILRACRKVICVEDMQLFCWLEMAYAISMHMDDFLKHGFMLMYKNKTFKTFPYFVNHIYFLL